MRISKLASTGLLFSLTVCLLTLGGCILVVDVGDGACFGYAETYHRIPNLTLVPGEAYTRDLEDPRNPIFGHVDGLQLDFDVRVSDGRVAHATISNGVLHVYAEHYGRTRIYLEAFDYECDGEGVGFSFTIDVVRDY